MKTLPLLLRGYITYFCPNMRVLSQHIMFTCNKKKIFFLLSTAPFANLVAKIMHNIIVVNLMMKCGVFF